MKYVQKRLSMTTVFLFLLALPLMSVAQKKTDITREQLQSMHAVFKVQTVLPSSGGIIHPTSDYDVKFSRDSVIAYLPYFGRAYTASMGEPGGIQFTSTAFDYKVKERKKGKGWEITIAPRDTKDVRQLYLFVSPGGSATLQVQSLNRQSISYNGSVQIF